MNEVGDATWCSVFVFIGRFQQKNRGKVLGDGTIVATGATKRGVEGGGFAQRNRIEFPSFPDLKRYKGVTFLFRFSLALSFDSAVMAVGSVKGDS